MQSPFNTASSSFFEQTGHLVGQLGRRPFPVRWAGLANPTFGGYLPGAGLSTNFGLSSGNFNANFGFTMSQGARQSLVGQAPFVTLMNGQTGFVSDTSQTPFVISEAPVVGAAAFEPCGQVPGGRGPMGLGQQTGVGRSGRQPGGVHSRAARGHGRPAAGGRRFGRLGFPSVAEARRMNERQQAAQQDELRDLMERGRTANGRANPRWPKSTIRWWCGGRRAI